MPAQRRRRGSIRRNTSRLPWAEMKAAYVEGIQRDDGRHFPTYREVAEKFGANVAHVRDRGGQDNWVALRAAFQDNADRARQAKLTQVIVATGVDFDRRVMHTARAQLRIIRALMAELIAEGRKPGANMEKITIQLNRLAVALVRVQHVGRVAIGAGADDFDDRWLPDTHMALSFSRVPQANVDPDSA